jgi:hypothetical protein
MKSISLALLLLCFILLNVKAQDIDCNDFELVKQEILSEIDEISHVISPRLNPRDRQFLERRLDEIAVKLDHLSQQSYTAITVYPMSENDFNLLMATVENQKFESEKTEVIQRAASNNYFVTSQLIRLLEKYSFDDERLKLIGIIYPALLDKEQSFRLYDYLTFNSSKEKLKQIILENSPDNR